MLKIRLKTKSGYRLTKISNESFIYYRKTKYGYIKRPESQIKKIHENILEQKSIIRYKQKLIQIKEYQKQKIEKLKRKYPKRYIKKSKQTTKTITEKELEHEITEEPLSEEHRHQTLLYDFICKVSDRILPPHTFGFREEALNIFGSVEAIHEDKYPDHTIISYKFKNTFSIEDKGVYNNFSVTEKQKDFLHHLGFSREEISLIPDKRFASRIISKKRKV